VIQLVLPRKRTRLQQAARPLGCAQLEDLRLECLPNIYGSLLHSPSQSASAADLAEPGFSGSVSRSRQPHRPPRREGAGRPDCSTRRMENACGCRPGRHFVLFRPVASTCLEGAVVCATTSWTLSHAPCRCHRLQSHSLPCRHPRRCCSSGPARENALCRNWTGWLGGRCLNDRYHKRRFVVYTVQDVYSQGRQP
jgi:hypothetical protein